MKASRILAFSLSVILASALVLGCAPRAAHPASARAPSSDSTPTVEPAALPASKPAASASPTAPVTDTGQYARELADARAAVEQFFGETFRAPYELRIFPNRAALTDFARQRWGIEKPERRMVPMGGTP